MAAGTGWNWKRFRLPMLRRLAELNRKGEFVISASAAQQLIFESVHPLAVEEVPLLEALGRYLGKPVIAPCDLPPFDNSAMDGYAVRSADLADLTKPMTLAVTGVIPAGHADPLLELPAGHAMRIMTGAPLPPGADTVIPFEHCETRAGFCVVSNPVRLGDHVRKKGEDVTRGLEVCLPATRITSRQIALLAALGLQSVVVHRRPRVSLLVTGTELVEPGRPLMGGKIYNSNGPALEAALREAGIVDVTSEVVGDSAIEIVQALDRHIGSDLVITVGGVSAGDFDLVPKVLKDRGATILFHKVAIKPGKPLLFAVLETPPLAGLRVFGLPGNPVSALMVFDQFVRPALLKMMGAGALQRPRRKARALERLRGSEGKEDYLRGLVHFDQGGYVARSAGTQGSAQLLTLSRANATLILPEEKKEIATGESVEVELWENGI